MQQNIKKSNKSISIFGICMFSIIAVDSIRALPINAAYGPALVSILLLGGLLFLLPCALISAELASAWPQDGGLYVWVREAFGLKTAFVANWLLWIYNIIWFPTIMAFICATLGSAFFPNIMAHKSLLLSTMIGLFWLVTAINCLGIKGSSLLSTLGTIVGTLLPILFITGLGLEWYFSKQPLATHITLKSMLPHFSSSTIGLLPSMVFGLVGIEVSASFAGQVKNPQRNFPIAMLISSALILTTLVLGSLAILFVVPTSSLNLATGIVQAFQMLFNHLHMPYLLTWIIACIVIGSVGGISTWMAGPSRNMMIAAQDGIAPKFIGKANRFGAASNMLISQAVVFSFFCGAYILFPKFNSAYALLSDMTGQLALLVYLLVFAAAICLRYNKKDITRPFKAAKSNSGMWVLAGVGWLTCAATFVVGFIPPTALKIMNPVTYETLLILVIVSTLISGILIANYQKSNKKNGL